MTHQRTDVVPPPPALQPHGPGPHPGRQGDPFDRVEAVALAAGPGGLDEPDPGRLGDQPAGRVTGVRVGGRRPLRGPLADRRQQGLVGLDAHRLTGLDPGGRARLVRVLQLLDPPVERGQQPVLLVDHALPHGRVHQQVGRGLRPVQRAVLHAARRDLHPEDVVVRGSGRPVGGHRRLEEDGQRTADAQGEGVLQRARRRRYVLGVAVLVVGPRLGVRGLVQLAETDPVYHAVPQRAGDQGVLGASDRSQQQRARLQPAQMVPVALLLGADREQVHGTGRDQPQHLRALQVDPVEACAVDGPAHGPERAQNEVSLVCGRHLTAP